MLFKNNKPARKKKSSFSPPNCIMHWSARRTVFHQGSLVVFKIQYLQLLGDENGRAIVSGRDFEPQRAAHDAMVLWQRSWVSVVVSLGAAILRISCAESAAAF